MRGFHHQYTHAFCVYFDIRFLGLAPIYPNVILKDHKNVVKNGGYVLLMPKSEKVAEAVFIFLIK